MVHVDINDMIDYKMYSIINNGLLAVMILDYRTKSKGRMNEGSHMVLLKNQIEDEYIKNIIEYIYDHGKENERNKFTLNDDNIIIEKGGKQYYADYDNYVIMLDIAYEKVAKGILNRIKN